MISLSAATRWLIASAIVLLLSVGALRSVAMVAASEQSHGGRSAPVQDQEGGETPAGGIVEGVVTFRGKMPQYPIADNAGTREDLLRVHRKSGGLQYAVVYLDIDAKQAASLPRQAPPTGAAAPRSSVDSTKPEAAKPARVAVDQRDYKFVPLLIAVRSGVPVKFTNSDSGNHNIRAASLDPRNQFNVYTGAGADYVHRFYADPKNRPVRLGCDLHAWMRGWIYVFDHPYHAVTDADGRFRITGVAPGEYRLIVKQPAGALSAERAVRVTSSEPAKVEIGFTPSDLKGG